MADLRQNIIDMAKKCGADIVGFAPIERFEHDKNILKIYPETKTVIGFAFRVLRGIMRTIEEGTTYYQYTTMGVENLEEVVMPLALIRVAEVIEDAGFDALPQRRHYLMMEESDSTNPEVFHNEIKRGTTIEKQIDFEKAAVACGLGEKGFSGQLLTKEFGPFQRYCFILTDAELAPSPVLEQTLCDNCGECRKACHGKAIREDGSIDKWNCAVYYAGANGKKNPFMPPEAYVDFEDRLEIIAGEADVTPEKAREIIDNTFFYPPAKHSYISCICGRACDRACYIHLEKQGKLTKSFKTPFREGEDWELSTEQFKDK